MADPLSKRASPPYLADLTQGPVTAGIAMRKVVVIVGTGHCGSTLLDMMLSSHPAAFGLGELKVIAEDPNYRNGWTPPNTLFGYDDPVWTPALMQELYRHFRKETNWVHRAVAKYRPGLLSNRTAIYRTLFAALPDKTLLVDSSKNARYSRVALHQLRVAADIEPFLLWIWRDPRAVINSYRRKFPEVSVEEFIRRIKHMQFRRRELYDELALNKAFVRYEDLCTAPAQTIRQLCALLDLDYRPDMLTYWKHDHHHLGGNAGTKTLVAKYQEVPRGFSDKPWSAEFYRHHPLEIRLDERWKTELPAEDQAKIVAAFALESV